jgi:hypothetical protein
MIAAPPVIRPLSAKLLRRVARATRSAAIAVCLACIAAASARAAELSLAERVDGRQYPSIAQPWDNVAYQGDVDAGIARHDLFWHGSTWYGLMWNGPTEGEATSLVPSSIAAGLNRRADLLTRNDHLVLLAELRYRDAWASWLPDNSPWWMRDNSGNKIAGWLGGTEPFYLLDYHQPAFRAHLAQQAAAIVQSGVVDGIMLDIFDVEDASRVDLVQRVRAAIGPDKLIIVNSNANKPTGSAPYINGLYMEVDPHLPQWVESPSRAPSAAVWQQLVSTLQWAEATLQEPRINVLETWYTRSRSEPRNMRMTTTAALTLSNGYSLFGDPNYLPAPDHAHDWYEFWNLDLGQPSEAPQTDATKIDGGFVREFAGGQVVFNPLFNSQPMTRQFASPVRQASTGLVGISFTVPVGDGDVFQPAGTLPPPDWAFETPNALGQALGGLPTGWIIAAKPLSGGIALEAHASSGIVGGEGLQHLRLADSGIFATTSLLPSAPLTTVTADTRYWLTVSLGNDATDLAGRDPGQYDVSLLVDGAPAATLTLPEADAAIPEGEFRDFTIVWDSPAAGAAIGKDLSVLLSHTGIVGKATGGVFDNVRLASLAITPGDFNVDGVVDGVDFLIWQNGVGILEGATRGNGDADGDGAVTALDLQIWSAHLVPGEPPSTVTVPEPRGALGQPAAALLVAIALAWRGRRTPRSRPQAAERQRRRVATATSSPA